MLFDRFVGLAGVHHFAIVLLIFFGELAWKEVEIRLADDVAQFLAQDATELLIGKSEAFFEIFSENILGQGLDEGMIQGLGIAEIVLGLPALGDVFDGAFVVEELAFEIAHRVAILRNPDGAAILAINT